MDTDLVQRKIERFIFRINSKNKSFDMLVQGSLRLDALTIKAREKQTVNTISHLIDKEGFVCPKCLKADRTSSNTTHTVRCYRCNRIFIKPNQPKCKIHNSMKPCRYCEREKKNEKQ